VPNNANLSQFKPKGVVSALVKRGEIVVKCDILHHKPW
jgi:hypothetical protein